jgi:hypothetical protein
MTHTPGLWDSDYNGKCTWTIQTRDGDHIGTADRQQDACLIVAAPDMLAALKYWFDSKADSGKLAEMARAAINKAEGGQP